MKILKALIIVAVVLLVSSCSSNNAAESVSCNGVEVKFSQDVLPLITASCATNSTCHASGSNEGPGALTNYTRINAAKAEIKSAVLSGSMPKNSSLTSTQRNTIVCWIENGALNN